MTIAAADQCEKDSDEKDEWFRPFGRDLDPKNDCYDLGLRIGANRSRIGALARAYFKEAMSEIEIGVWPAGGHDHGEGDDAPEMCRIEIVSFGPGGGWAASRDLSEMLDLAMPDSSQCGALAEIFALEKLQRVIAKLIAARQSEIASTPPDGGTHE